jgi:hypothetical protein
MGKRKWVVQAAPLMHGTEGRVWLSVAQCLVNGDLGRLRRCIHCKSFFQTDDARRQFCTTTHQKEHDAAASKARMKLSRQRRETGVKPPKKKAKDALPSLVSDEKLFADFLESSKGSVNQGDDLPMFVKRRIPGDWRTVRKWYSQAPAQIWAELSDQTKQMFRNHCPLFPDFENP